VIFNQDSDFVVVRCPAKHGLDEVANLRVRILEIPHLGHSHTIDMQFPAFRRIS
jgi:hypothetical protein